MEKIIVIIILLIPFFAPAQNRWKLQPDGSILWEVKQDIPHYDHIEMSGEKVSTVLRYGVNADGSFQLERSLVWPILRTIPNNTHASLMQRYAVDFPSLLTVNGGTLKKEQVKSVSLICLCQDQGIGEHLPDQRRTDARSGRGILLCSHLGQRPGGICVALLPLSQI